jgi:O-antigen/teichoic acid export membrane protein
MGNIMSASPIKKIIKDIRWYAPAKIIPGFFGFLAIVIYTRLLSPEEYGLYSLVITTVFIITAICFDWLRRSVLRYFEKYKKIGKITEFISTVVSSLIGIMVVVLILWYSGVNLFKNYLDQNIISLLNIWALVILAEAGFTFVLCIRQAMQESFQYAIYSVINAVAKLAIAASSLYFFSAGPKGIFWGMIIATGGVFLWDIFSFYQRWEIKISYSSKELFKKLLVYGFPLMGLSIASYILTAADRYMIKYFLTTEDVGVYSASYSLSSEVIQFPIVILFLASYPVVWKYLKIMGRGRRAYF